MVVFDFSLGANLDNWYIMDDVVMGGRSSGDMKITDEGHGLFHGQVSLENNGGFSSVRYRPEPIDAADFTVAKLYVKGDEKSYQFRVKESSTDRHSYIYTFETSGEWEVIEIALSDMYPSFRGRKLDMDNYKGETLGELAFLISNKKAESFNLEIDKIILG